MTRGNAFVIMLIMSKFLRRTRLHIWIACFAILLNALAPSVSHALAALRGAPTLVEVCSVAGSKMVAVDQAAPDGAPSSSDSVLHHLEHCPYCINHAGSAMPPPALPTPFAVRGGHDVFPSLFYHAPTPLFSWSAANPRAPPAVC
jgi:hypothetical protein